MSFISRAFNQIVNDPFTKIVERFWGTIGARFMMTRMKTGIC